MTVTAPTGSTTPNGLGCRRNRGVNWTEEETEQLLEAWAEREVQSLLENGPHNRQAFERVSFNLAQRGMDKTPTQCREKIKKLKTIFRNINSGHGKVSRKIRGRLVQKLHQVMGGVPVSMPSETPEKDPELYVPDGTGHVEVNSADFLPNSFQHTSLEPATDFLATGSSTTGVSSSSEEAEPVDDAAPLKNKGKRKSGRHCSKRSRRSSPVYVLVEKMMASQTAWNERFAALEERRLLLDKELEEKRLEAEAKRQEAQREHELRLLSTMAQQMANVLKSLNPLTFTGARCEAVATPITVAVSGSDPTKSHEVVTVGVTNGCADYGHPDATVYSSM